MTGRFDDKRGADSTDPVAATLIYRGETPVVECTWITGKHIIMSAAQFIHELEAMSKSERESIFASLVENQEWREDLFDLMTIADRRNEPVRPIDEVFSDLKIDA